MKRSRSIRLVLLGTAAVALAACGDDDETVNGQYFADAAQCSASVDSDTCRQAVAEARSQHMLTAPQYSSREQCEQDYGPANCGPVELAPAQSTAGKPGAPPDSTQQASTPRTGSSFIPLMTGFWLGRNLSTGGMSASPVYHDAQNRAYSGRSYVGNFAGNSFTADTARGGFGRTAQARAGGS